MLGNILTTRVIIDLICLCAVAACILGLYTCKYKLCWIVRATWSSSCSHTKDKIRMYTTDTGGFWMVTCDSNIRVCYAAWSASLINFHVILLYNHMYNYRLLLKENVWMVLTKWYWSLYNNHLVTLSFHPSLLENLLEGESRSKMLVNQII